MRVVHHLTFLGCLALAAHGKYVSEEKACECVPLTQCATQVQIIDVSYHGNTTGGCSHYLDTCCSEIKPLPQPSPQKFSTHSLGIISSRFQNSPGKWQVKNRAKPPLPSRIRGGCGQSNPNGASDFRIVNNSEGQSQFGEWPWMVAIVSLQEDIETNKTTNLEYHCGGSLIHRKVVLTAAHCVNGMKNIPRQLKVLLGEWDTQTENEGLPIQEKRVSKVIVHEKFEVGTMVNDVALLILHKAAQTADNVDTVCLPRLSSRPPPGTKCFATGWGKDKFGKDGLYQVILKSIDLPIVSNAACQDALRTTRLSKFFKLHDSFLCAGGQPGIDTCKGDGGSPLVCPVPGRKGHYEQVGVVSWGIGCGEVGVPGVYADVARFRAWVDAKMSDNMLDNGSYTWPNEAVNEAEEIDIGGRDYVVEGGFQTRD